MLDLTIPNQHTYQQDILDKTLAAFLAGEISNDQAMDQITTGWENLTNRLGRSEQKGFYHTSLGIEP